MPTVAVKKLSISLDEDVAEAAVRVAAREGLSVSAWLNRAAERAIKLAEGRVAVQEYFAEHGEPSDEDRAWAREIVRKLNAGESPS